MHQDAEDRNQIRAQTLFARSVCDRPWAVFLASDRSSAVTGRVFTARGGYVGLHREAGEDLLAIRNEADGAWPIEELATQLESKLGLAGSLPSEGEGPA